MIFKELTYHGLESHLSLHISTLMRRPRVTSCISKHIVLRRILIGLAFHNQAISHTREATLQHTIRSSSTDRHPRLIADTPSAPIPPASKPTKTLGRNCIPGSASTLFCIDHTNAAERIACTKSVSWPGSSRARERARSLARPCHHIHHSNIAMHACMHVRPVRRQTSRDRS